MEIEVIENILGAFLWICAIILFGIKYAINNKFSNIEIIESGFYFGIFTDSALSTIGGGIFMIDSSQKLFMIGGLMAFLFWVSYVWIQYQRNYLDLKKMLEDTIPIDSEQGSEIPVLRNDI